ncbi:MAG: sulfatase [Planctomycetota bacterium]
MKRRPLVLLVLVCAGWFSGSTAQAEPKSVLFIAVDDLNDWTSYLGGHPQTKTPNIDALVARGVSFTNAHCTAPGCNPSRTSLMTGLRPWETGVYFNPNNAKPVLRDTQTINRHFLANGYQVFGAGKIYHGKTSEGRSDTWTKWGGPKGTKKTNVHNVNELNRSHFDWGPLPIETKDMGDAKLTDWAIEKLQKTDPSQPLFLAVGYVKPHLPWYVPQKYFDRFPIEEIQLPKTIEDDLADIPMAGVKIAKPTGDHAAVVKGDEWAAAVQGYLATISFLDDQVGRLMRGLDESGRANDTVIVWWSDHGWHLGEKQHWRKFALWQDATRTSFAVVAPGLTKPGGQCDAPVDYLSIYPTLCDLAGLSKPSHVTGPSLTELLKDPKSNWDGHAICTHGRGNHAIYLGDYHLIRYADGSKEFYNRVDDPHEWKNLVGEKKYQGLINKMSSRLPDLADEELERERS